MSGGYDWKLGLITPELVEERLIEAFDMLDRLPDRERGWLRSTSMKIWREAQREWAGYSQDTDDNTRRLGLRTAEVDRMNEALNWCEWLRPADRQLLREVIRVRQAGYAQVPWTAIRVRLGWSISRQGLQRRYSQSLYGICVKLNAGRVVLFDDYR